MNNFIKIASTICLTGIWTLVWGFVDYAVRINHSDKSK
jgi:hypothetical protein